MNGKRGYRTGMSLFGTLLQRLSAQSALQLALVGLSFLMGLHLSFFLPLLETLSGVMLSIGFLVLTLVLILMGYAWSRERSRTSTCSSGIGDSSSQGTRR